MKTYVEAALILVFGLTIGVLFYLAMCLNYNLQP